MNTRNTTRSTFFTRFFTATIATAALATGAMAQFPGQNTNTDPQQMDPIQLEQMYNELSRGNYSGFMPNVSEYLGGISMSANPNPILNGKVYILTVKVNDPKKLKGSVRLKIEFQYRNKKTGKIASSKYSATMKVINPTTAVFEGRFSFNATTYTGVSGSFQVLTPDYDQLINTFVLK